jgi:hypothetical protein
MQRLFVFVLLASLAGFAQTATTAAPAASAEDQIIQLTQRWLAAGHSADPEVLDALESEDFIATTPSGDVVTKSDLMPDPGSSNRLPKFSLADTTVRVHGDTAVLMARLVGEEGGPTLHATNVFVRSNGKWVMIAAQLSRG